MKILVLNCGSSSLKYQLIDMENEVVMAKGYFERIGMSGSFLNHKVGEEKHKIEQEVKNHDEAIEIVINQLLHPEYGVISSMDEITAVGHRAVHGGEQFKSSVIIDDEVMARIRDCIDLAPLHTPAVIAGIEACKNVMPGKKMVAVFDTAFHQTMAKEQYLYAIPYEYYEKYGVRKYGFHGTSHKYVANRIAEIMGKPVEDLKIINCHLGQGASLCAIKNGKSVDTTMGFTPLSGVPMGSRCGDIDPSIATYLMKKENLTSDEMDNILNKKSGILGLSGISADFRDIETAAANGDERAKSTIEAHDYIVAQYIAKFMVTLGGADVITFTAGVGENGIDVREDICKKLEFLGIKIDSEKNRTRGEEVEISTPESSIKVYIVPTNEELMIARDTMELVK